MANEPIFDAFSEGVGMGGLRSKTDIQLLICYLMESLINPVSVRLITDVCQDEELANYFEVQEAISELVDHGILRPELTKEEEVVELTEQGKNAVAVLESDLPKSVRDRALNAALHFQTLARNAKENDVKITPTEGGYHVTFTMEEQGTDLMKLSVFVTDRDQAEHLKNNFMENPAKMYAAILDGLMVD